MPTEGGGITRMDFASFGDGYRDQLDSWETDSSRPRLLELSAEVGEWEKLTLFLMAARSINLPVLVRFRPIEDNLSRDQFNYLLTWLRDWDQLTLANFLALFERFVPDGHLDALRTEARLEEKWFHEWLSAQGDARIHRYPSLPWRRFIRKIVGENYAFADGFLGAVFDGRGEMDDLLKALLVKKKEVVSLFPKRWGNNGH